MYAQDSFFTLGPAGQIGLAMLTLVLTGLMLWLVRRLGRSLPRAARIALALALFWAFLWLSPQVYYLYYQTIIPGLPWQSVIKAPPGPADVMRIMTFQDATTLSAHGRALLGWGMLAVAVVAARTRPR